MATNSDKLKMLGQYDTKTEPDPKLIKKGKNVYGLPPDKIPGNRPNIQWSKAAAIKDLGYDAAEAKVLQKLLIEKLQKRLKEVDDTKFDVAKLKLGTTDRKKLAAILKKSNYDASQVFTNINTEGKALKRALGSMLQTDADFFAERGVWDLLTTNLDRLEGEELFRVVKGLDASISGSKGGLVGHHTSLSASTKMLDQFDEPWQNEYLKIAKDSGYDLGERSLKRIQGLAHKPVLIKGKQTLKGDVAERLAPLMPDVPYKDGELVLPRGKYPKVDAWLDKMGEISAHGKEYGGTVGFEADAKGLSKSVPQKAFDTTRNIYDAEKVAQHQAYKVDTKLKKVLNIDFPKENFTNIDDAADFLLKKANQKDWQPDPVKSSLIAEAKGELGEASSLERKGIDPRAEADRLRSKARAGNTTDVLDQPATVGGLDYDSPNVPGESFEMSPRMRQGRQWMMKMQNIPGSRALTKVGGGINKAEAAAMIVGGQYIPGTVALAMQSKPVQTQIAKLIAKQGVKLIPGVSFGSGVLQGAGYALSGKYGKAALSVAGGIAGEVPGYGDVVQGMIDLGLTVDDIKQAKAQPQGDPNDPLNRNNKKQFEVEAKKVKPSSIGDAFTDTLQKTGKVTKNLL